MIELTEYERDLLKGHLRRMELWRIWPETDDEILDRWIAETYRRWEWTDKVDVDEIIRDTIRIAEEFQHGEG